MLQPLIRRLGTASFVLLCMLSLSIRASAQELLPYRIESEQLSFSLPADWRVHTLDQLASDDADKALLRSFEKNHILLSALSADGTAELSLTGSRSLKSNRIHNFTTLSPTDLEAQGDMLVSHEFKKGGIDYTAFEVVSNEQMRFLSLRGTLHAEDGKTADFLQYSTIVNGAAIQFTLYRYGTALLPADLALAAQLAENLQVDSLTAPGIDTAILLKLCGLGLIIALLIASVFWNVRRYRKKACRLALSAEN